MYAQSVRDSMKKDGEEDFSRRPDANIPENYGGSALFTLPKEEAEAAAREKSCPEEQGKPDSGLLSGLLRRFERLETDDLLLIGLMLLLAKDREKNTEMLIVLAVRKGLSAPLANLLGANCGRMVRYFLMVVVAGVVWPLTFQFFPKGK